ncbi:MAG: diaminopimelate epimerase [Candidatus Cloacimonetes bacterium]|jgi:diaminopimelate epimerase|nr:diaminopimelate epimerase [Candidatus Cloacimonadota bacterium]MDD3563861.1 diaminopimelate epimerase [Candidatus Cloacimonadota bacterium]MDY0326501.1 diaminopimelate epimerase [Candidatus Cloacimonadaceae bacterium]
MLIAFQKMQAQGNDFVILDYTDQDLPAHDFPALASSICDRHFGVGADGLVTLQTSDTADARMIIYNSDGSRAEMCGSALRCVSSLLMDKLAVAELNILTDSGLKQARRERDKIIVNMGTAQILEEDVPAGGFVGDLVNVGNPHYVVFCDDISGNPHLKHGAMLEHHPAFPSPVNVHFVQVLSKNRMRMKIWEHACGPTLACGTGASSAVYSGIRKALLAHEVTVEVPGGILSIIYQEETDTMLLCGPVTQVFSGDYSWKI